MMRRLLTAVVLFALLAAPASAKPRTMRSLVPAADGFITDGERYAVWLTPQDGTTADRLFVLDTATRQTREIAPPPDCTWNSWLYSRIVDGHVPVPCDGDDRDLDLATGLVSPLPVVAPPSRPEGSSSPNDLKGVDRCEDVLTAADRLRREGTLVTQWERPYLIATYAVGAGQWLELHRCGARPVVLARHQVFDETIGAGLVTWHNTYDPFLAEDEADSMPPQRDDRLTLYDIAHRRRISWLPPTVAFNGQWSHQRRRLGHAWHTANTVFWVAMTGVECDKVCGPGGYRVFSAPIPAR